MQTSDESSVAEQTQPLPTTSIFTWDFRADYLEVYSMSRADASKSFEDGIGIINQITSDSKSPNQEYLLIQAVRCLERAVELLEEDDPSYNVYAQACASAGARCVMEVDCSAEIDMILSSSPLLGNLSNQAYDSLDNQPVDIDRRMEAFDMLWDALDDFRDDFYMSHNELFSSQILANHIISFGRAIEHSQGNQYLKYLWYGHRATTLYLRIDKRNPDEIALCIASMRETIRLQSTTDLPPPGDMDLAVFQILPEFAEDISSLKLRLQRLESLASTYMHRHTTNFRKNFDLYKNNSDPNHLEWAISDGREALSWGRNTGLLPDLYFKLLVALGRALHERYWSNQVLEDIEDSAECLREALKYESAPEDRLIFCKQFLSTVTADLAKELSERLESNGWLKSLDLWRESVKLTGPEVPELLVERLYGLADTAFKLYNTSEEGTSDHITEAGASLARAASTTSSPRLCSEILFNRASIFYARFARENTREDFDESLRSGGEAWQLLRQEPELIQLKPQWDGLYRHGARVSRRIQEKMTSTTENMEPSIQQLIQIFDSIILFPYTNRPNALNHLGRAYTMLFHSQVQAGRPPIQCAFILEKSLEYHQMALDIIPKDRTVPVHPRYTFLGVVNHDLSRIQELDSESRIRYIESAIGHFRKANYSRSISGLRNLAAALEGRYKILGQTQDLDECVNLLQTGESTRGRLIGHPKQFLLAATQLVRICREHNITPQLLPAYRLLFQALRRLSNMGLTSIARHRALVENSVGHACDAASAALAIGDSEAAVELLEDGRGLFFSQLLPMQTDTKKIHDLDPKLASSLEFTLDRLQYYSAKTDTIDYKASQYHNEGGFAEDIDPEASDISPESMELRHYAEWLRSYIDEVRELPGYEEFMKAMSFSRLKGAAKYCPVVYINVSQYRCDAIIIGTPSHSSQIIVVPLAVSWHKVYDLSRTIQTMVKQQGRDVRSTDIGSIRHFVKARQLNQSPESTVKNVLKQLWESIVHPILETMGCLNGLGLSSEKLQRACWCPTGPAATSLPFHAAGNYDLGPEHWAVTHIISSYTPTLSALVQADKRDSTSELGATRMLLVSLPATPPSNPLACVIQERDEVVRSVASSEHCDQSKVTVLHDSDGRVQSVKSMLPTHQLLHLACHGIQDRYNPLDSAITLYDGNLTLREIIKMSLQSAELVYLSACQTATGDTDSPDESLSLAGGFLFSGYRSAVATMWSINDKDGADVASAFYKHLMEQSKPSALGAGLALHQAIRDLRRDNPNIELIRWIPFVCFGITR
ncbi:CHAT domain protein [Ceratobasidium sp. AG-Ba]|nr:CHAT domain protein [Ceratobasidium sp. AG-Ba]